MSIPYLRVELCVPSSFLMEKILFFCLCCIISWWKNLVFFLPSLSQFMRDFCFHNISSCFHLSSGWLISNPTSLLLSSLPPLDIIYCCNLFILSSNRCCSLNISPNSSLFHFLIFSLISFSFRLKVCNLLCPLYWLWSTIPPPLAKIAGSLAKKLQI